jgi:hypothetical protein
LTLEQVNYISRRAYELGETTVIPDRTYTVIETDEDGNEHPAKRVTKGGVAHSDAREKALDEFKTLHEIIGTQWVRKAGN